MRTLLVKIACKLGIYKTCVSIDNYIHTQKVAKAFRQYGLEVIEQVNKVAAHSNVKIFPTFGTLLGAYREHGFIAHDYDLDFGMLASERSEEYIKALQQVGFKHIRQIYVKETNRVVEDNFEYKGVSIDIFYYFEENDSLYSYIMRRHETKDWRIANTEDGFPTDYSYVPQTTFEPYEFLNVTITIPTKTKEWLTDIFGPTFMTPVKNFNAKDFKTRIVRCPERTYRKYF